MASQLPAPPLPLALAQPGVPHPQTHPRLEEHTPVTAEPTAQLAEGTGPWGSPGAAGTGDQPVHLPLPPAQTSLHSHSSAP